MKRILTYLLTMLLLTVAVDARAQVEKSTKTEVINGKKFYMHPIRKGESVSLIAKAYGVTKEEIFSANPGSDKTILAGEILKIPYVFREDVVRTDVTFVMHTIVKGESVSVIAEKYKVKVADIYEANPGSDKKIRAGDILKIPVKKETASNNVNIVKPDTLKKKDTVKVTAPVISGDTICHTVQKDETLYSLSQKYAVAVHDMIQWNPGCDKGLKIGQVLVIRGKKRTPALNVNIVQTQVDPLTDPGDCAKPRLKSSYNVVMLIPFYLRDVYAIKMPEVDKEVYPQSFKSFAFLDFYQGALIALDSAKKFGIRISLSVFDTDDDSLKFMKVIEKPEIAAADLIIGPFYEKHVTQLLKKLKGSHTRVISPLSSDSKNMSSPNLIKLNPTLETQMGVVATYLADSASFYKFILVYQDNQPDQVKQAGIFRDALKARVPGVLISEVAYNKTGMGGLEKELTKKSGNLVYVFSEGQVFIGSLLTSLSKRTEDYRIKLFGMPAWRNYTNVESEYLVKLNTHLLSQTFVDYQVTAVSDFVRVFRSRFLSEPDKYAFQGYDCTLFFLKALQEYGLSFPSCMNRVQFTPLVSRFRFEKCSEGAWENKEINIYRYFEYKLQRVN